MAGGEGDEFSVGTPSTRFEDQDPLNILIAAEEGSGAPEIGRGGEAGPALALHQTQGLGRTLAGECAELTGSRE